MRFAWKGVVADGRGKTYGMAVEDELPVDGRQRGHNFSTAAASATVHGDCVFDRDIENPLIRLFGDDVHKSVWECGVHSGPGLLPTWLRAVL